MDITAYKGLRQLGCSIFTSAKVSHRVWVIGRRYAKTMRTRECGDWA